MGLFASEWGRDEWERGGDADGAVGFAKAAYEAWPEAGAPWAALTRGEQDYWITPIRAAMRIYGPFPADRLVVCDAPAGCGRIAMASEGRLCVCGVEPAPLDLESGRHITPAARDFMRDVLVKSSGDDRAEG